MNVQFLQHVSPIISPSVGIDDFVAGGCEPHDIAVTNHSGEHDAQQSQWSSRTITARTCRRPSTGW
jgi:hypothetical protein